MVKRKDWNKLLKERVIIDKASIITEIPEKVKRMLNI